MFLGSSHPLLFGLQGDDDDAEYSDPDFNLEYDSLYPNSLHHQESDHNEDENTQLFQECNIMDFRKKCSSKLSIKLPTEGVVGDSLNSSECTICMDSDELVDLPCGHKFCYYCLTGYLLSNVKRYDGVYKHKRVLFYREKIGLAMFVEDFIGIKCPEKLCNRVLSPTYVKKYLDDMTYNQFDEKLLREELYQVEGLESCKLGCGNFIQDDCLCTNEECKVIMIAERERIEKERLRIEKLAAQHRESYMNWAQSNARICPNCYVLIEKNGGCNNMYCTRCKSGFRWDTTSFELKPVKAI